MLLSQRLILISGDTPGIRSQELLIHNYTPPSHNVLFSTSCSSTSLHLFDARCVNESLRLKSLLHTGEHKSLSGISTQRTSVDTLSVQIQLHNFTSANRRQSLQSQNPLFSRR